MPWYINPVKTRKVLNRIADRYERAALQDLKSILDHVTELVLKKQEHYFKSSQYFQ